MKISEAISFLQIKLNSDGDVNIDISEIFFNTDDNKLINKFKISIGDWSEDRHGQYDVFNYETNVSIVTLQNAFKKACENMNITFNRNYNGPKPLRKILGDYENNTVTYDVLLSIESKGIDIDKYFSYDEKEYTEYKSFFAVCNSFENCSISGEACFDEVSLLPELILDIAKTELDFEYEEASVKHSDNIAPFNGWWCDNDMNFQIGYGCYGG